MKDVKKTFNNKKVEVEEMARQVSIGSQSFENLREKGCFYIDKTYFIRDWWKTEDQITLITRPRRFGKTLNMNMLECFFSDRYAGRSDLFEGLDIWEDKEYRKLQGTYPVINLSFAEVKSENYQQCSDTIQSIIKECYQLHSYLMDSEKLGEDAKQEYKDTINGISVGTEPIIVVRALKVLSKLLYQHTGTKPLIFLDEYDTPMQEAYLQGYWDELVSFIRNLFNATFKTNPYLGRAVMTGITRVSKESMFSDLNNPNVCTVAVDQYATAFGFTEEEVFASMDEFDMGSEKEKMGVKNWYDGFTIGNHHDIYNPWSITNFLRQKVFKTYWVNTSSNGMAGSVLQQADKNVKVLFEQLMQGESIEIEMDDEMIFSQLGKKEEAIWALLLCGGYLKAEKVVTPEADGPARKPIFTLKITNRETEIMFGDLIKGWFGENAADYNDFVKALLLGDLDAMNEYMNDITEHVFSYFDTGKKPSKKTPENFYHGFVLGLLVTLRDQYDIKSNRESGFGRYDIRLEPKDKNKDAIIIEFKVLNLRREKGLEECVANALKQIEDNNYAAELIEKGFQEERIRKYGFAFEGQRVLIG